MASNIDPTKPSGPVAYTADVRTNFATTKTEIEAIQDKVFGPLVLTNLPTSPTGLPTGTVWNNGGVLCVV
jgi:hypothetical protein